MKKIISLCPIQTPLDSERAYQTLSEIAMHMIFETKHRMCFGASNHIDEPRRIQNGPLIGVLRGSFPKKSDSETLLRVAAMIPLILNAQVGNCYEQSLVTMALICQKVDEKYPHLRGTFQIALVSIRSWHQCLSIEMTHAPHYKCVVDPWDKRIYPFKDIHTHMSQTLLKCTDQSNPFNPDIHTVTESSVLETVLVMNSQDVTALSKAMSGQ